MNQKEHKQKAITSAIQLCLLVWGLLQLALGKWNGNALVWGVLVVGALGHGFAFRNSILKWKQPVWEAATKSHAKGFSVLRLFYWFCGKENRENVQLTIADLKRDEKEMKKEGRGFWFIKAVVFWRAIATIVPITWDGVMRVVKAILPFAKYFKG